MMLPDNTKKVMFALSLVIIAILLQPVAFSTTGALLYGNISITITSANAPYIYPMNIVVHAGDHVNILVDAEDIDGNILFYNDTCDLFNVNSAGEIDFIVPSSISSYSCTISVTDLFYTNTSTFTMQVVSECGDGFCDDISESCEACALDCGICTSDTRQPEVVKQEQLCTAQWSCTDWGRCQPNGYQERTCRITNGCTGSTSQPSETKQCAYKSNQIENELQRAQSLITTDRRAATQQLSVVVDTKTKDVQLLQDLKFDLWQNLGIEQADLMEINDYLYTAKDNIITAGVADVASAESLLRTTFSQMSGVVSKIPEVVLIQTISKNVASALSEDLSSKLGEKVSDIASDVVMKKTYSNYEISNTETSDQKLERAKVVIEVRVTKTLPELVVIERVDKQFAKDVKSIVFYNPEMVKVIEPDPVFQWTIDDVKEGDIIRLQYIVIGHINDSETSIVLPEAAKARANLLGQAIYQTRVGCNISPSYRILSLFFLFILVACLIITNLMIPINVRTSKDTKLKILSKINSVSYYGIFVLSLYVLALDMLCFDYTLLKELLAIFILVFTTYYLNRPLRLFLQKQRKTSRTKH